MEHYAAHFRSPVLPSYRHKTVQQKKTTNNVHIHTDILRKTIADGYQQYIEKRHIRTEWTLFRVSKAGSAF